MALSTLVAATRLLPGAVALLAEHAGELPQKDELYGPFCGLVVPATHHHQMRELVTAGGLRAQLWDNGSRDAAS